MSSTVYHTNHLSADPRPGGAKNVQTFGASGDTAATAIAGVIADVVAGKQVRLTKRGRYTPGATRPDGTRNSASVLGRAANGAIGRFRLRNVKDSVGETALAALFTGQATIAPDPVIAALSAAPKLPGSHQTITTANVAITLLP